MLEIYKKKILSFYKTKKRMPSYSEIMETLSFKSKNSVFKLIDKLSQENFLAKDSKGKLIPKNIYGDFKLLGSVEAGFPAQAEEELLDTMSLDDYLINNKEASYLLKVSGDSMKEAGIIAGDMVLVDRSLEPNDKDIVIAEVDSKWTMKYFRKNNKGIYLQAANKKYKDIYPREEIKIAAVVKAVIRKY